MKTEEKYLIKENRDIRFSKNTIRKIDDLSDTIKENKKYLMSLIEKLLDDVYQEGYDTGYDNGYGVGFDEGGSDRD
jgi:hypothetical protein